MMAFGKDIDEQRLIAQVRQELPIRIAHRIRDLQNLPFVVGLNPNLERVYTGYLESFARIQGFPPIRTLEQNDEFCQFLEGALKQHWGTIPRMMVGLLESSMHLTPGSRERFMQRMLRSRISRRVLAEQHMALTAHFHDLQEHGQSAHRNRNIGVIDTATSLRALAEEMRTLLPLVTGVSDTKIDIDGVDDARFPFIPEHLRFILLELCKNAVYAAVRNGIAARISITLADAQRTVGVRVSDQSGGIPLHASTFIDLEGRSVTRLLPSHNDLLSFAHPNHHDYMPELQNCMRLGGTAAEQLGPDADVRLGLPGQRPNHGMALGLCKVYAEYFGGSLQLNSMYGFGTDAYLTIPKLGITKETST
ncbi:putative protein kinase [Cystobasidiomycetes sp. EMM_F5]